MEQANWLTRFIRKTGSFSGGMWDSAIDIVKANFIGYN